MKISVIGGGINGICIAWMLAEDGHQVQLFEKGKLLSETSSKSSKLLHGGIRYLENLEFRLVKEALNERSWWLENVPQYAKPLKLYLPTYDGARRPPWMIEFGLFCYDKLAGKSSIANYEKIDLNDISSIPNELNRDGLKGVFSFFDGQMDEEKLGDWVVSQARNAGVLFHEGINISRVTVEGCIYLQDETLSFDVIINSCGPWAEDLLKKSDIKSAYQLDLIRGSHLMVNRSISNAYLLEVPNERRVVFILPYQGKTMIGTTEVRQKLGDAIVCSEAEKNYLLSIYNHYFEKKIVYSDISSSFSGVRPLIRSANDPGKMTREYAIERNKKLITVFGGKWTTARALGKKIVLEVKNGIY